MHKAISRTQRHGTPSAHAFALGSSVFVLFVVLIGVCVWRSWLIWQHLPATHPNKAYFTGMKIGVWLAPVILPLLALVIAWGIGKIVSLCFGDSDDAGNVGAGLVMAAIISIFGYSTYMAATAPPASATQTTGASGNATREDSLEQRMKRGQEAMDRMASQMQAQQDAAREVMERSRRPPNEPLMTLTQQPPISGPSTESSTSSPVPSSATGRAPSTFRDAEKIEAVRASIENKLDTTIAIVVERLNTIAPDLRKQPRQDIRELRSRAESIASARDALKSVEASLKSVGDNASTRLSKEGLGESESRMGGHRIAAELNVQSRAFTADRLADTLDHALKETELMRDNIGKWKYGKDGKVESKDFQLQAGVNSARFFLNSAMDRWNSQIDELKAP
jgi:hypothetical protein